MFWTEEMKQPGPPPKVLVACPTWSGMAYAMPQWSEAVKSFTYPDYITLMVDNSDGPPHGNLHYTHLIRACGIDAVWQPTRFPFLWDTLELSWRTIVEHAHAEGCEFILSLEADIIAPPDTIEVLLKAAYDNATDGKPAVVTHRYHPRGQEADTMWFDTLGCSLFPVEPLYAARNRVMAIFEIDCFIITGDAGYKRHRARDLLDLVHLRDPDDHLVQAFGATPAKTAYTKRREEEQKKTADEAEAENPEDQPSIPMGKDAVTERPVSAMVPGGPADEPYGGRRTLADRKAAS